MMQQGTSQHLGTRDDFTMFGEWTTLLYPATPTRDHPDSMDDLEGVL